MKKFLFAPVALLALAACQPTPELDYCSAYGVSKGDPEFVQCTQYYFENQAAFNAERAICSAEADRTYPPTLYSRPYSYPARFYGGYGGRGGFGGMGYGGGFGGFGGGHTEMVHVGADYQHNAQVDALRARIMEPCMQKRGWNSGVTWTAGRHAVGKAKRPAPAQKLPWQ